MPYIGITKNKFCYNHPDKSNFAKGLCYACYYKQWYANPIYKAKAKRRQRGWNKRHPEQFKKIVRNNKLKAKYGITLDNYNKMFDAQKGQCAVCGKVYKGTLHVDHNHETGQVRELLCPACNYWVAIVENVTMLMKIQQYIAKHNQPHSF